MPFNFNRDLVKKLISLFPAKFIREHFIETGNIADVIEEVSSKPVASILSLVRTYQVTTRQNVRLYTLGRAFNAANDLADFPLEIYDRTVNGAKHTFYLFPETVYTVYLDSPMGKEDIGFLQPIVMEIEGSNLSVRATKLQKDIRTYFPQNRNPKIAGESNLEAETIQRIFDHFAGITGVNLTDFNTGIKTLWTNDDIDCHKIKFMDADSTSVITMNNTLTFKQEKPEEYARMEHSPIGNSVWKFLTPAQDGSIIDTFTCDPTEGTFSLTKFAENTNHLSNVINRILEQN